MSNSEWKLCGCGFLSAGGFKALGSVRTVFRFDYEPILSVSSCWDACHVYAQPASPAPDVKVVSVTLGRWKREMERVKEKLKDEEITEITEIGCKMLMKTLSKRVFVLKENELDEVSISAQETGHSIQTAIQTLHSIEDGKKLYTLSNGRVCASTLTSGSVLELGAPISKGVTIRMVSCGNNHVLLLSKEWGRVWSFGLNHHGELGHGDLYPRPHPTIVEALDGLVMVEVCCGKWHSLVLSECRDVYSWGWNANKQLGHSADSTTIAIPTLLNLGEEVKSVQCGARHSAALSTGGRIWTWGWNDYGQLGHSQGNRPAPIPLAGGMVLWIHCGPWNTLFLWSPRSN